MNWIFLFLLGWHPPLEVPPVPPLDWRRQSELRFSSSDWFDRSSVLFTTSDIAIVNPKDWTLYDEDITLHSPHKPMVTKERNGWKITFKLRPVDGKK